MPNWVNHWVSKVNVVQLNVSISNHTLNAINFLFSFINPNISFQRLYFMHFHSFDSIKKSFLFSRPVWMNDWLTDWLTGLTECVEWVKTLIQHLSIAQWFHLKNAKNIKKKTIEKLLTAFQRKKWMFQSLNRCIDESIDRWMDWNVTTFTFREGQRERLVSSCLDL